jgi:hypothetical protein
VELKSGYFPEQLQPFPQLSPQPLQLLPHASPHDEHAEPQAVKGTAQKQGWSQLQD